MIPDETTIYCSKCSSFNIGSDCCICKSCLRRLIEEIDEDKLEEEHQKDSCGDPYECHYWKGVSDTKKELLKKLNCETEEVQER